VVIRHTSLLWSKYTQGINARATQGPTDRVYQEFVSKLEEEDLETGLEGVVDVGIFRFRSKIMSPTWVLLQVIDPFYQSLDLKSFKNKPVVGRLCWIASPHIDRIPRIMDVERESPTEHYATKFKIRNMTYQRQCEPPKKTI
jgi:hypothetical protein